jgi:cytoskeletal protein RodZ
MEGREYKMGRLILIKGAVIFMFFLFLAVNVTQTYSAWWKWAGPKREQPASKQEKQKTAGKTVQKQQKETTPVSQPAAEQQIDAAKEKKEAEVAIARQTLSSRQWTIYLTPMSAQKKRRRSKMRTDELTFTITTVTSKGLSAEGYAESNYTITVKEDGTVVWETMQTGKKGDLAFWRGELKGMIMQGILSKKPLKGEVKDFYFSTQLPEGK